MKNKKRRPPNKAYYYESFTDMDHFIKDVRIWDYSRIN